MERPTGSGALRAFLFLAVLGGLFAVCELYSRSQDDPAPEPPRQMWPDEPPAKQPSKGSVNAPPPGG